MENWSQFYTPMRLSDLLINSIEKSFSPNNIIDICAGSCNLLNSAYNKWPQANLYASDIEAIKVDSKGIIEKRQLNALNIEQIVLRYKDKSRKLVLANPPFGQYTNPLEVIQSSNLKSISESLNGINRIECLITLSNLAILNKGDYFAAILPENMFSGDKLENFRINLFKLFSNLQVKKHTVKFEKSEVKTRIMSGVFKGAGEENDVKVITTKNASSQSSFTILRGINNSLLTNNPVSNINIRVLHFSNKAGNVSMIKTIAYSSKFDKLKVGINDIIIFRVGRNAGGIIFPDERHVGFPISDILLILKNGKQLGKIRLNIFEKRLKNKVKGLTSKYISKKDVLIALEEY